MSRRAVELFQRGNQHHLSGESTKAIQCYKKAVRIDPKFAEAYNNMGFVYTNSGDVKEALNCYRRAINVRKDYADAHNNLSLLLHKTGQSEDALHHSKKAIALNPDAATLYNDHGSILLALGQREAAEQHFKKAIDLAPQLFDAHHNYAAVHQYTEDDPHLQSLESMLPHLDQQAKMRVCFALGKANEDIGRFDKSFDYLAEANRIQKAFLNFDPQFDRKVMHLTRSMFNQSVRQLGNTSQPTPLLIVGMPRSGTSLVEQILASHSEVYGAGELDALLTAVTPVLMNRLNDDTNDPPSHGELENIFRTYRDALKSYPNSVKLITDKMPLNFRFIGFFLSAFPAARVVHVERNPIATCWSIYKHFFPHAGNAFGNSLEDLALYHDLYVDMMDFWRDSFPEKIYRLSYEKLTENQEAETRALLTFCELDWQPACLDFHESKRSVRTASASQVRQAMYQGSSENWRRFEKHLKPLIDHFT